MIEIMSRVMVLGNVEHALATAASDAVKVAKLVETSVLPALKTAQAISSTIEVSHCDLADALTLRGSGLMVTGWL